ncbi:uncharacterized protein LOC120337620 isoform X1 [Styela clava]
MEPSRRLVDYSSVLMTLQNMLKSMLGMEIAPSEDTNTAGSLSSTITKFSKMVRIFNKGKMLSITKKKRATSFIICNFATEQCCTVGEAICCHSLALLYCTAHFSNLQLKKVPPAITGTMQLQSWHHPRSEGFKQLLIQKIIIRNPSEQFQLPTTANYQ